MHENAPIKSPFSIVYIVSFLYALSFSLPLYINSSFLEQFVREEFLGFIYALVSLCVLFILPRFPEVIRIWGNFKTAIFIFIAISVFLALLSFSTWGYAAIALFIAIQVLISLGLFTMDIFLETFTENKSTGTTRGYLLTVLNSAIFLGPLLAGFILTNGDYWRVYLIAAFFLIPAIFLVARHLKQFEDPPYQRITFWATLGKVLLARHPYDGLRHAIVGDFLLRFFYAWMIVYMPIYLHKYIGFAWSEVSIVIAVALLPFMLFEIPIGKFVDRTLREKEVMIVGFCIAAFFTFCLFFVESASLALWAALLFGTRVGASFIEIASESYFFKRIDKTDTNILSVFRNTQPLAFIAGPLIASLVLLSAPFEYLFLVLGFILLTGILNGKVMPGTEIIKLPRPPTIGRKVLPAG